MADAVRERIGRAIAERVTPAAVVEVGRAGGPIWSAAFGTLTWDAGAARCEIGTVFDLASLTKVIVAAPLAMQAVATGRLSLETPVRSLVPAWSGADRQAVTVRHLLEHSSGLPAHERLWQRLRSADEVDEAIARVPLAYAPGTTAVYSDLGFLLLGRILERVGGARLDALFGSLPWAADLDLWFNPSAERRAAIAPTEFDAWRGRVLRGEVHDENAAFAGGVAAHAGLFGTAAAVGTYARLVLETFGRRTALGSPDLMRTFATPSTVPGSSRALAWDTMRPTSSCGRLMSARAIGHTGFTGTSLWVDPDRDAYVVLLTNRVHPTREGSGIQPLRADVHDLVMREWFSAV